jgi:putative flippase GtrA
MQSTSRSSSRGGVRSLLQRLDGTFAKFIFVGALAYFVNQAALLAFYDLHLLPFTPEKNTRADLGLFTHPDILLLIASALAVQVAIVFKFYVHEHWTFRDRPKPGWAVSRFARFNASSILNPIILVATVNILTLVFDINAYVSNTVGTLTGFLVNWFFSHRLIWPHDEAASDLPPHASVEMR